MHFHYMENDAKTLSVHYTWKVAEGGLKMAFMMNKLARINSVKLFLKNKNNYFRQKLLWNSGAHYTCTHIILDKIRYQYTFLDHDK